MTSVVKRVPADRARAYRWGSIRCGAYELENTQAGVTIKVLCPLNPRGIQDLIAALHRIMETSETTPHDVLETLLDRENVDQPFDRATSILRQAEEWGFVLVRKDEAQLPLR